MSEVLKIWDPHFHIWDVRPTTTSGHDGTVLFAPNDDPIYTYARYESDLQKAGSAFEHIGGAFVEAVSVCHLDKSGPELTSACLAEAQWVAQQLNQSAKEYVLIPTAPLEDPNVAATLSQLATNPNVRGIRQILNFKPSWPRNEKLGDLLDNPQWQKGFEKLAHHSFSFDLQLNPHQFLKAATFLKAFPETPIIINHLGTPTLSDLQEHSTQYWTGMEALAAYENTFIKISMLPYPDPQWDENLTVVEAIYKVIELFGTSRCFFASNFPVDQKEGWPADRLYKAFRKLAEAKFAWEDQQGLFAENARHAYRVSNSL